MKYSPVNRVCIIVENWKHLEMTAALPQSGTASKIKADAKERSAYIQALHQQVQRKALDTLVESTPTVDQEQQRCVSQSDDSSHSVRQSDKRVSVWQTREEQNLTGCMMSINVWCRGEQILLGI